MIMKSEDDHNEKNDGCCIIKKTELKEYQEQALKCGALEKELENVKEERDKYKGEYDASHIKVDFNVLLCNPYSYYDYWSGKDVHVLKKELIDGIHLKISDNGITIEGKSKSFLKHMKTNIQDTIKNWLNEIVDKCAEANINSLNSSWEDKYNRLLDKIEEHNDHCFFDRNKIKIDD